MFDWLRSEDMPLVFIVIGTWMVIVHILFNKFWPPKK
jgi:hypothetical protein